MLELAEWVNELILVLLNSLWNLIQVITYLGWAWRSEDHGFGKDMDWMGVITPLFLVINESLSVFYWGVKG